MKHLLVLILASLFSSGTLAKLQTLETDKGRIFIPELQGWELGKDLFGMPFIYFSPQVNGQRSNISFTSTGVNAKNELANLGKDTHGFKKMKIEWAQKAGALTKEFFPYKVWKNTRGHEVHELGLTYVHETKTYVEKSLYVDCRGKLVFIKSLRLDVNSAHEVDFDRLVKELDCAL